MKIDLAVFTENDWNHMHDCILNATWETTKTKSTREELIQIFNSLPDYLQEEAMEYGMNDTVWRENFTEYFTEEILG